MDQLELIRRLHPLQRDIVSRGIDQAFEYLKSEFPIDIHEFDSGSRVWTWTLPAAWECTEAFVEDDAGRRIIDIQNHPLHVASGSVPVDTFISGADLRGRVFSHPILPEAIPFIFYYYQEEWAFCANQFDRDSIRDDATYRAVIHSTKQPSRMKLGVMELPGDSDQYVVLSTNLCHPYQANDSLSGVATGLKVFEKLRNLSSRKYRYILLIGPETIGSVAWLATNEHLIPRIKGGLFTEMTGTSLPGALARSFDGDTEVDVCFRIVHKFSEEGAWDVPYRGTIGNDERQFNAPGVRIPMLSYSRVNPWGHPLRPYPEYHSSMDTPEILSASRLDHSAETIFNMLQTLERNYIPVNKFKGEVFLAGQGIAIDRNKDLNMHRNMLRIMDYIDGRYSVARIASILELSFDSVFQFIEELRKRDLVGRVEI